MYGSNTHIIFVYIVELFDEEFELYHAVGIMESATFHKYNPGDLIIKQGD